MKSSIISNFAYVLFEWPRWGCATYEGGLFAQHFEEIVYFKGRKCQREEKIAHVAQKLFGKNPTIPARGRGSQEKIRGTYGRFLFNVYVHRI